MALALGKHAGSLALSLLRCTSLPNPFDRLGRGQRAKRICFGTGVLSGAGRVFDQACGARVDVRAGVLPHGLFSEDAGVDAQAGPRVRFQRGMQRLRSGRVLLLGFDHARVGIDSNTYWSSR